MNFMFFTVALRPRRTSAAFGFDKPAFVAAFHIAKDRRIQRRVRRLPTGAFPQPLVDHRGNHFLGVYRFTMAIKRKA